MGIVEDKFESTEKFTWKPVSYFEEEGFRSCVDGREPHAIVGSPGGDAGDFVLLLAMVESVTGKALTSDQVAKIFEAFVRRFGSFYLHTDSHAVQNLISHIQSDSGLSDVFAGLDMSDDGDWISQAASPLHASLLPLLLDPSFVGCGHLRLMLQESDVYGVRKDLVKDVIQCFFQTLWDADSRMHFVVLKGSHAEQAVCSISSTEELNEDTKIPFVPPLEDGKQVFVHHGDVAHYFRSAFVDWFAADFSEILSGGHVAQASEHIHAMGNTQLGATLERLAKGLPVVEIKLP